MISPRWLAGNGERYQHHWLWYYNSLGLWLDNGLVASWSVDASSLRTERSLIAELTPEEEALVRLAGYHAIEPPSMT